MRISNFKVIGLLEMCENDQFHFRPCQFNVEYSRDKIGESLSIQMETEDGCIVYQIPFKDLRRMINGN